MNGKIMGEVLNVNGASAFLYTLSTAGKQTNDTITIECPFVPQILFGCMTSSTQVFGNFSSNSWLGTAGSYSILVSVVWEGNLITGKVYNTNVMAHLVIFG